MPEGKNKNTFPQVKPGMVFGYLEVIEKAAPYRPPGGGKPTAQWKCRCKLCGNEITLRSHVLHTRKNKSCGCIDEVTEKQNPKPSVTPGMVFGELEVKERAPDHFTPSGIKWSGAEMALRVQARGSPRQRETGEPVRPYGRIRHRVHQ